MSYEILSSRTRRIRIPVFNIVGTEYTVRTLPLPEGKELHEIYLLVRRVFEDLLDQLLTDSATGSRFPDTDRVRLSIRSDSLDHEIWIHFVKPSELTVDRIFISIENVLQSKREWFFDRPFQVYLVHAPLPVGGSKDKVEALSTLLLKKKRSILELPSLPHNLCFAAAVLVAKKKVDGAYGEGREYRRRKTLLPQTLAFQQAVGVPVGVKCGPQEWQKFQTFLDPDYELVVLSADHLNSIVFRGRTSAPKRIAVYHAHDHYYPTLSLKAFFGKGQLCEVCLKPYNGTHICPEQCYFCLGQEACSKTSEQYCGQCNLLFPSPPCFERHKRVCGHISRCRTCGFFLRKGLKHTCNQRYCAVCSKTVEPEHQCYMKPLKPDPVSDSSVYVFFDFESMLTEDASHKVNLVVAHLVCGLCMTEPVSFSCSCDVRQFKQFPGENALDQFLSWLFGLRHKQITCLAHNGRSYDFSLVLQHLHRHGLKPEVTQNGCKIMQLKVKGRRFIDSLSFLPMALKKIPAAFGLTELCKGYFPHKLNVAEWQDYVGPYPPKDCFDPDSMSPSDREGFNSWYDAHSSEQYDFQQQLRVYCESDVDILRRGVGSFRRLFISCTEVDPLRTSQTIASACNKAYRTNLLKEEQIAILAPKTGKHSPIALAWIAMVAEEKGFRVQHARNGGEKRVMGKLVDGFVPPNTVLQFSGCFMHACPVCMRNRDAIHPVRKIPVRDVHSMTLQRNEELRRAGYDVIHEWECRFRAAVGKDRLKELLQDTTKHSPLEPRDAFYGGRTESFKLYHKAPQGSEIRYEDVISLYPHQCKTGLFPVGPPVIYIGREIPEKVFGLLKCTVLPPRTLHIPLLPYRTGDKLVFPLCRTCAVRQSAEPCKHSPSQRALTGTWTTLELDEAVRLKYEILERFEAWHFEESTQYDRSTGEGGLWADYVNTFLKVKVEASGYPPHVNTAAEREAYVEQYRQVEGIQLDPSKIQKNPGLRSVAKLCLNSFWGKFAQNDNLSQHEYVNTVRRYVELMTSDDIHVQDLRLINEKAALILVQYVMRDHAVTPGRNTNVVLASFVTSQARLQLYGYLNTLGDRALYCDTDSVIYSSSPGQVNLATGEHLGQLCSEYPDDVITEAVLAGPKNYALRLASGNTLCKIRGFSLNYRTSQVLNFEKLKEIMMRQDRFETVTETVEPHALIKRRAGDPIYTTARRKLYKFCYDKRVVLDRFHTKPFGYIQD